MGNSWALVLFSHSDGLSLSLSLLLILPYHFKPNHPALACMCPVSLPLHRPLLPSGSPISAARSRQAPRGCWVALTGQEDGSGFDRKAAELQGGGIDPWRWRTRFVYRWRVLEFSGGLQEVFGSRCYFLRNFFLQDAETLLRSRSLTRCTCSDSWIELMVQLR